MELYKAGSIEFTFVTGTDNEILNITPLKAVPLQRFEIFWQGGAIHRSHRQ